MIFDLSMLVPRSEVPKLSLLSYVSLPSRRLIDGTHVVSIVGHPHLRPDQQDLPIVNDHSAVEVVVLVSHWPLGSDLSSIEIFSCSTIGIDVHSNITNNVSAIRVRQDLGKDFPRVQNGIT
jgi:hypothetical protein